MSEIEVVLYGASGYTGEHVMWKLAELGIPFIAAGRNKERLTARLAAQSELKGARYEIAQVEHTEEALTELFKGKKVVHNLVGPYMQYGEPVVRAALNADCHYLDATGEQDWKLLIREKYGKAFADKGLALSPAVSSMWISGLLAAESVLEKPGIDSVDILYTLHGVPSAASTLSFMRMCCQPQYRLVNNKLEAWPAATHFQVAVPGHHRILTALPWSGGGESLYYERDERVINCSTMVTFQNQALMEMLVPKMQEFAEKYAGLGEEAQEAATNEWANQIAPQGDQPREDYSQHRVLFTCHGRGTLVARSTATWGVTGYVMTGLMGATVIDCLIKDRQRAVGFVSPLEVTGVKPMRAALEDGGVYGQMSELIA
ncbi:saccharopine dehydrogenase family protein [Novosphingobium album (ex Hu et al. 2023)]|uniref:DUF5938 domain-containing protein n=1 Tax=Novosphingobium album (ex Hu et al. 2023) TaxID=2930093 RepID=A0ABT0AZW9_9SPHN|nr:DUF5938 domain-containing protein [Novosphingobium album (ex Hu et al. 2023)]MCJ2178079.1 DUF5938 domain-containing protein [Novosphingobium album (ex Hu et al. 2023)]